MVTTPDVGQSINVWGTILNDALTDLQDQINDASPIGMELAYAENNTAAQTALTVSPALSAPVAGETIIVPPHPDYPVVIDYGGAFRVGTSGGGVGSLSLWSFTIAGVGTQIHQSIRGYTAAQITSFSGTEQIAGRHRLAPSDSELILQLRCLLIRDSGSSLTLFLANGITANSPTFLAARAA